MESNIKPNPIKMYQECSCEDECHLCYECRYHECECICDEDKDDEEDDMGW